MRNYYILGSHRQVDGKWIEVFDAMVEQRVVDVGFGWEQKSLAKLYGKPEAEIVRELKRMREPQASYTALKHFLQFKPGDLIAIKKHSFAQGKSPKLVIHGYAKVVERGGMVYRRGKPPLNHSINVDYLEHGTEHSFPMSYAQTIHRLEDAKRIRAIFGPILKRNAKKAISLPTIHSPASVKRIKRMAALTKNVEDQVRNYAGSFVATQLHNRLQLKLRDRLCKKFGAENVRMEEDFLDFKVRTGKGITIYEVKPHPSATACIREALGQTFLYAWRLQQNEKCECKVVVVGPNKPDKDEMEFIDFVRKNLRIGFEYRALSK